MSETNSADRPKTSADPVVLQAGLAYVRAGLSVVPIAADGSKLPHIPALPREWDEQDAKYKATWKPFQERLPTEEEVRQWFADGDCGLAVVSGAVSGHLELLDFDIEAETLYPAWYELVEAECPGLVARLSVVATPKPGYHVRYRCPEVLIPGNTKLAEDPAQPAKERTLIETRGEGGYGLAPGCPASCHPKRKLYKHHGGPKLSDVQAISGAEREVLIRCARSFHRGTPKGRQYRGAGHAASSPGGDFNTRGPDWAELLEPHGWACARTSGEARYWRRPGKEAPGWSATTGVCRSEKSGELFYVFSGNAEPFEAEQCYSRFAVYTLLNHGGDFKAAAKALAGQGYGRPSGQGEEKNPSADDATKAPWPDLAPPTEVPPAPFPVDVLPKPMRDYCEAIAASMPCPVDMPACIALAAAGVAIGTTRRLAVRRTWSEQARLWIAVVCRPGSKKSPAADAALDPMEEREERLGRQYREQMKSYREQMASWDGKQPEPEEPVEQQVIMIDTTRESLAELMSINPRGLLLHRDELAGWTKSMNQYKGKGDDRQIWLSLWSGGSFVVNRRKEKIRVRRPFIGVCGNIPPGVLSELQDERDCEDGFVHRILFSWPQHVRGGWTDCEPDPDQLKAYKDLFEKLFALEFEKRPLVLDSGQESADRSRPVVLGFTVEGRLAFADFIDRLSDEVEAEDFPDQLRGPWSKMEGYCARFALLLHVCRQAAGETEEKDVDEVSVGKAVRLADYFLAHARRVYPRLINSTSDRLLKDVQAILAWVRRNRDKIEPADEDSGKPANAFTWRMVRHDLHQRFENREHDLFKALELLAGRGYLREIPRERPRAVGRRPQPDYLLNPETWCRNDRNDQNGAKPSSRRRRRRAYFGHFDHFDTGAQGKNGQSYSEEV